MHTKYLEIIHWKYNGADIWLNMNLPGLCVCVHVRMRERVRANMYIIYYYYSYLFFPYLMFRLDSRRPYPGACLIIPFKSRILPSETFHQPLDRIICYSNSNNIRNEFSCE